MMILGIDPGSVRAGYGLIVKDGAKMVRIDSGLIDIPSPAEPGIQLLALEKGLEILIRKFKPDIAALENIFFSKNKKTGIFVAQARGLIAKVLAAHGLRVIELSPSSIKLAVAGDGRADKNAVAKMVGLFLKIKTKGLLDDETDALAAAIAASSQTGDFRG